MAKNKDRRRPPVAPVAPSLDLLGDDMRRHVEGLGFASICAYFAWCRQHGFSCSLHKPGRTRRRELEFFRGLGGAVQLTAHERVRNPAEAVRRLLAGEVLDAPEHRAIAAALRDDAAPVARRALLVEVLRHLAAVLPDCLVPRGAGLGIALRIAEHWRAAVRPIADWRPRTHNERRALGSLIEHLFARYDAPPWLLDAWFANDDASAVHRAWYVHVAAGNNLRTAPGLPFLLTKRMAHECAIAPPGLSALESLRFGQVRGLGGGSRLALAIAGTRLGSDFANGDFWVTFVLFCVRHRVDDVGRVTAMVDFLHEHRHGARTVVDEHGRQRDVAPVQPGLSMHARTPESLQKQIDAWHGRLSKAGERDAHVRWEPSGIAGYRAVADAGEPTERVWAVRELCSAVELRRESAVMRHCVLTYIARCRRGDAAIFTLTRTQGERTETVATIEVRAGRVVQARGPANRPLAPVAREQMRRWAIGAGVTIASWV